MKKIFIIILLAVVLFLAGNIGEVEAQGCSYYDVTWRADGESWQGCWEICIYEDGFADIYTDEIGMLWASLGDLGTDEHQVLAYADGYYGCPGAAYVILQGKDQTFLKGEGTCEGDFYRVEGKKTDYCEGGGE